MIIMKLTFVIINTSGRRNQSKILIGKNSPKIISSDGTDFYNYFRNKDIDLKKIFFSSEEQF